MKNIIIFSFGLHSWLFKLVSLSDHCLKSPKPMRFGVDFIWQPSWSDSYIWISNSDNSCGHRWNTSLPFGTFSIYADTFFLWLHLFYGFMIMMYLNGWFHYPVCPYIPNAFYSFEPFGIYFAIIFGVIRRIYYFLIILILTIVSFTLSFHLLLTPKDPNFLSNPDFDDPNNPWNLSPKFYQLSEQDQSINRNLAFIQVPEEDTNLFTSFHSSLMATYLFLMGDSSSESFIFFSAMVEMFTSRKKGFC